MSVWNIWDAELEDTRQAERLKKKQRRCLYCGRMTYSNNRVCSAHSDLPALERLEASRSSDAAAVVASSPASSLSSAAALPPREPEPCGPSPVRLVDPATNGDASGSSGPAALPVSGGVA